MMKQLEESGFYIIRGVVNTDQLEFGRNAITKTHVDYTATDKYVNEAMMDTVKQHTGLNLKCVKYRVSNNNNSVDAAGFHRDLQAQLPYEDALPVYTVLSYMDQSQMELIPGSHVEYIMNFFHAFRMFFRTKKIIINPGDILIFHASMIHRGIFYKTGENRRLIQCFDCIPLDFFDEYHNTILHLPCKNMCNAAFAKNMVSIAKIKPIIEIINFFNYFNTAMGYGADIDFIEGLGYKGIRFLSTEAENPRLVPKKGFETINRYIISVPTRDQKDEHIYTIHRKTQVMPTVKLVGTFITVIALLVYTFKKVK